nr:glycosyltransferase family A protein [uncultured Vibrio sp.]
MKVSVIIPTHDRVHSLKHAIDSVVGQSISVNEIIVVDDTGSENTKLLVESYKNISITFIHNHNNGASSSRNLGAKLAKSDFLAFLDDDDTWFPDKLEKQVSLVKENHLDAVFSQLLVKYDVSGGEYATKARNVSNPLKSICIENYIGATISCLIRRELFLELKGFDEMFLAREEYDLWIRVIESGAKIGIVEEPLAISNRSFSRERISSNISSYESAIDLLNEKHKKLVLDTLNESERKHRESKQYCFLAAQAISINKGGIASKYYFKSFSPKSMVLAILSLISPKFLIMLRSKM